MALTPCTECGGMIAHDAEFCPHCGHPTGKRPAARKYTLTKGRPGENALGNWLHTMAIIVAVVGAIAAIAGSFQQQIVSTRYGYETQNVFSWTMFFSTIASTVESTFLLWCMGTVVNLIQGTYDMVSGIGLKEEGASNSRPSSSSLSRSASSSRTSSTLSKDGRILEPLSSPDSSHKEPMLPDNPSWSVSDRYGFVVCPGCGKESSIDYLRARKHCPSCNCKY